MMGQRLKEARLEAGLTQTGLAELLDVKPAEISQYEADKRTPRWDKFNKLLDILNVSSDYLLGREITLVSDDDDYQIKVARKDMQILEAIKSNRKLYKLLLTDPDRNARALNSNIKNVFPE